MNTKQEFDEIELAKARKILQSYRQLKHPKQIIKEYLDVDCKRPDYSSLTDDLKYEVQKIEKIVDIDQTDHKAGNRVKFSAFKSKLSFKGFEVSMESTKKKISEFYTYEACLDHIIQHKPQLVLDIASVLTKSTDHQVNVAEKDKWSKQMPWTNDVYEYYQRHDIPEDQIYSLLINRLQYYSKCDPSLKIENDDFPNLNTFLGNRGWIPLINSNINNIYDKIIKPFSSMFVSKVFHTNNTNVKSTWSTGIVEHGRYVKGMPDYQLNEDYLFDYQSTNGYYTITAHGCGHNFIFTSVMDLSIITDFTGNYQLLELNGRKVIQNDPGLIVFNFTRVNQLPDNHPYTFKYYDDPKRVFDVRCRLKRTDIKKCSICNVTYVNVNMSINYNLGIKALKELITHAYTTQRDQFINLLVDYDATTIIQGSYDLTTFKFKVNKDLVPEFKMGTYECNTNL